MLQTSLLQTVKRALTLFPRIFCSLLSMISTFLFKTDNIDVPWDKNWITLSRNHGICAISQAIYRNFFLFFSPTLCSANSFRFGALIRRFSGKIPRRHSYTMCVINDIYVCHYNDTKIPYFHDFILICKVDVNYWQTFRVKFLCFLCKIDTTICSCVRYIMFPLSFWEVIDNIEE